MAPRSYRSGASPEQPRIRLLRGSLNTGGDYFTHRNQGGYDLQRNGESVPDLDGQYNTDVYTSEAIHWIRNLRDRQKPFFLYLAYKAPHSPFQAPQALIDEAGGVYAAMMVSMDTGIGRILDALEAEGVADHTIVMFLSDNGATRGAGSNAPLRGFKLGTYEGGIRVVSVLRWPGVLPPGTTSTQVMTSLDVFPTLAAAAGVEVLAERALDGTDLWREISSGQTTPRADDIFYASENFVGRQFSFSVLRGNMKLVQRVDQTLESLAIVNELYDVFADPGEIQRPGRGPPGPGEPARGRVDRVAPAASLRRQSCARRAPPRVARTPGLGASHALNGLNANPNPEDNIYGFGLRPRPGEVTEPQRRLDRAYGNRGRLIYP